MMRRAASFAFAFALSGCATVPLAPDPGVDLSGRWTIVAVDGEPTGGGRGFNFELNPTYGSAQFGCNSGSGSYSVADGWFVAGDPWIFTLASCPDRRRVEFERRGIQILAKPLAIERLEGGAIRLRNERGSIELTRSAEPTGRP
jgi:heat shock protein HslJ